MCALGNLTFLFPCTPSLNDRRLLYYRQATELTTALKQAECVEVKVAQTLSERAYTAIVGCHRRARKTTTKHAIDPLFPGKGGDSHTHAQMEIGSCSNHPIPSRSVLLRSLKKIRVLTENMAPITTRWSFMSEANFTDVHVREIVAAVEHNPSVIALGFRNNIGMCLCVCHSPPPTHHTHAHTHTRTHTLSLRSLSR